MAIKTYLVHNFCSQRLLYSEDASLLDQSDIKKIVQYLKIFPSSGCLEYPGFVIGVCWPVHTNFTLCGDFLSVIPPLIQEKFN